MSSDPIFMMRVFDGRLGATDVISAVYLLFSCANSWRPCPQFALSSDCPKRRVS